MQMIDLQRLQSYLLEKPGSVEETPFGPQALVYKVMGKMFALVAWEENPLSISLKCDPDEALFLRDLYSAVIPGYHMNKRHWNTVKIDGTIPELEFWHMVDDSYALVVRGLRKADRDLLK
jgi:predicted DNA-binding protein (MmcQ/YjbR family)